MLAVLAEAHAGVLAVYRADLQYAIKQLPDQTELRKVMDELENEAIVREQSRARIQSITEDAIVAGAAAIGFAMLLRQSFTAVRARELALASKTADIVQHFANQYMRTGVVARVNAQLQAAVEAPRSAEEVFLGLGQKIEGIVTDSAYWKLTANQAASRATHYGMLKGAKGRKLTGYRLVATLDELTSSVCRGLHGKEFWVDDGIAFYDRILRAPSSEIKELHPWVKSYADIDGKTSEELQKMGIMCPPFHANCRTVLVGIA